MNTVYSNDKVAVVTGAGGTLCSEIALHLAKNGAKVVLIGRTSEKLEKVAQKIKEFGGTCMIQACDVTDEKAMIEVGKNVEVQFGKCDFLINGAGGNNIQAMTTTIEFNKDELGITDTQDVRTFFNLDMNMFESVLKINTIGTVIASRVFGEQMVKNGGGAIINFASMNSYCPLTRVPAYAMSKAAIVNYTQWLSAYFAKANIRVNAIAPGFFVNERSINYLGSPEIGLTERGKSVINHTPMARFGQASELLGCVDWLLDDEKAAFVTGITVPVDGGFLSRSGV